MHVKHKQSPPKGIFFIEDEGEVLAQLVYKTFADNEMNIEHTEVDKQLRGQNIGYELVHTAVEFARSHKMKILPVCPFAKAIFDKKPDFSDVLEAVDR